MTLDRIATLDDYANFARSFAGVAKARVDRVWNTQRFENTLTIAGPNGSEILPGDPLYDNLINAIKAFSDPTQDVRVVSFREQAFQVSLQIQYAPGLIIENINSAIRQALFDEFSFEMQEFGEVVNGSKILEVVQNINGVNKVDIDGLALIEGGTPSGMQTGIFLVPPQAEYIAPTVEGELGQIVGAGILTLSEGAININS